MRVVKAAEMERFLGITEKGLPRVGALKEPYGMSMAWEPERSAVTCITEILLIVTF